jgi:hypothetical protein
MAGLIHNCPLRSAADCRGRCQPSPQAVTRVGRHSETRRARMPFYDQSHGITRHPGFDAPVPCDGWEQRAGTDGGGFQPSLQRAYRARVGVRAVRDAYLAALALPDRSWISAEGLSSRRR